MRKNVNNLVALIPEWEFEKLNIKAQRIKVGNGVLINPKDLPYVQESLFSLEVFKLGGIPLTMSDATQIIKGGKEPIIFKKQDLPYIPEIPEEEEEIEIPEENLEVEDVEGTESEIKEEEDLENRELTNNQEEDK